MIRQSFRVALYLVLAGCGLWAQSTQPTPEPAPPDSMQALRPFGSGEQPRRNYAGSSFPRNVLLFSLAQETAFDDNVLSNNLDRRSDVSFGFAGRMAFRQERKRLTFALDYHPDLLLYRETPGNVLNHGLELDLNYQPAPRLALRLRNSLHYTTGVFHPRSSEEFMTALGAPARLNDTIFVPRHRTFEDNLRFDAVYQKSHRTSLTFFGGLQNRDFILEASSRERLQDTQGINAGVQYLHRLDRASTVGGLYLVQNLQFGDQSRALIHTAFFNYARRLSPGVTAEVFAGPQYMRSRERFQTELIFLGSRATLAGEIFRAQWHGALGGSVTMRSSETVFQISARRMVTDGGGLLISAVSNVLVEVSARRRLARGWHATWNLNVAHSRAMSSFLPDTTLESQSVGLALERSLTEDLTARLGYNFQRQRGGPVLLQDEIDRNRLTLGFFYQLGKIALGR